MHEYFTNFNNQLDRAEEGKSRTRQNLKTVDAVRRLLLISSIGKCMLQQQTTAIVFPPGLMCVDICSDPMLAVSSADPQQAKL